MDHRLSSVVFLVSLLLAVCPTLSLKCIHSQKVRNFSPHKLELKPSDRSYIQNNSNFMPIKITHTYMPLGNPTSPVKDAYIVKTVKIAAAYFNRALKVLSAPIFAPASIAGRRVSHIECYDVKIPSEHRSPFNSDLHLYVTSQQSPNESFLAWAAPCIINNIGRPIFGQVNYNTYYL